MARPRFDLSRLAQQWGFLNWKLCLVWSHIVRGAYFKISPLLQKRSSLDPDRVSSTCGAAGALDGEGHQSKPSPGTSLSLSVLPSLVHSSPQSSTIILVYYVLLSHNCSSATAARSFSFPHPFVLTETSLSTTTCSFLCHLHKYHVQFKELQHLPS